MLSKLWALRAAPKRAARRGGWKQRAAADSESEAEVEESRISRLAAGMLVDWSDGQVSAAHLSIKYYSVFKDLMFMFVFVCDLYHSILF